MFLVLCAKHSSTVLFAVRELKQRHVSKTNISELPCRPARFPDWPRRATPRPARRGDGNHAARFPDGAAVQPLQTDESAQGRESNNVKLGNKFIDQRQKIIKISAAGDFGRKMKDRFQAGCRRN